MVEALAAGIGELSAGDGLSLDGDCFLAWYTELTMHIINKQLVVLLLVYTKKLREKFVILYSYMTRL